MVEPERDHWSFECTGDAYRHSRCRRCRVRRWHKRRTSCRQLDYNHHCGDQHGTGGSTTTTPSAGNPTQLLDEWAACMRAHGDPGQADPTIDASKVIHLTWNDATPGGIYGTNKGGQGNVGPGQYCRTYIDTAQTDLQGGQQQQPSQAQLLKFSQCMRANGITDFPDPSNGGLSINRAGGGDLNPTNPVFQNASALCAKKTGMPGFASGGRNPRGRSSSTGTARTTPGAEFSAPGDL